MGALGRPIVLDGSQGEGGGALLRTALTMSSLTQQAVRVEGIRSGTKFPGLDHEDLLLMRALATSCAAETTGAHLGSMSLSFLPTRHPKALRGTLDWEPSGNRVANVPVIFNSLLPVLARTGAYSEVQLSGETYGTHSLSFDAFQNVTIPALRRLGLHSLPDQERAGFGRQSSGSMSMEVEPSALAAIDWSTRGKLIECRAMVTTAGLTRSVMERGIAHLTQLGRSARVPLDIEPNVVESSTPGAFVTVWASFEQGMGGAGAMGTRGLRIETLAQRAFEEWLEWFQGQSTIDPYLLDQVLIAACHAEGETKFKASNLTQRFLTSVWVIKQFLPIHITVRGDEGGPGDVTIRR